MEREDQTERFMWPGFLAKLRESFSLDPTPDFQTNILEQASMVGRHTPSGFRRADP